MHSFHKKLIKQKKTLKYNKNITEYYTWIYLQYLYLYHQLKKKIMFLLCKIKRTTAENFYIFLTYRIYSRKVYKLLQNITLLIPKLLMILTLFIYP